MSDDPLVPVWIRLSDAKWATWAGGPDTNWPMGQIAAACAEAVRVHETGAQDDMISVRRNDVLITIPWVGTREVRDRLRAAAWESAPPAPAEPLVTLGHLCEAHSRAWGIPGQECEIVQQGYAEAPCGPWLEVFVKESN